ncbi:MAG: hypothetical protein WKG01_01710 [Kofleriaceae bacterium]
MMSGHTRAAVRQLVAVRWRSRIWFALAVMYGIGLGFLPLFGVLGYELAIAMTLFAAIAGADLGRAFAKELQARGERASYPARALAAGTLGAIAVAVAVTMIPAVISIVRGIWTPTCDWWFGIKAYLALPVSTAVLGAGIGHAIGIVAGPRKRSAWLAQLPALVVAIAALWRFYSAPAVFTYNAILGYFPGNLYDENVELGMPLLWSRLEQLGWLIAILAAICARLDVPTYRVRLRDPRPAGRRLGAIAIAVVAIAGALALRLTSGELGYAVDTEDVEAALAGRLETEHFIIHYAKTPEIEADIELVARDHEFRYAQVVAQLGIGASRKLRSFYFADRDQKARLMGAKDVEMAKPWRKEIYLDHRSFPHGSLRHEIAHAVASEFGDPIFGVAAQRVLGLPLLASPGLVEGLAVAVDWPSGYDRPNPHESVRVIQAKNDGRAPRISSLLGLSFFSVSSAQGYTTAGSFLRFLLDAHGPAKLRAVYRNGGDFQAAYGVPLATLEAEWLAMLAKLEIPKALIEATAERFRGGSVFSRPCPHAIAARLDRAQAETDRGRAISLVREVCTDAPEEPKFQLALAAMLAGGAPAERTEAATIWTAIATSHSLTSTIRAQAYDRLAQLAADGGDLKRARSLVAAALVLPIDGTDRRQLEAYAFALDHQGPAGNALRSYFFTPGTTPPVFFAWLATQAEPQLGFAHYLLALQRAGQRQHGEVAKQLELALSRGLPGPGFVKNAARRLAVAAHRTHDRARLELAIGLLSGGDQMTSGDRLLAVDWLERLTFETTGRIRD